MPQWLFQAYTITQTPVFFPETEDTGVFSASAIRNPALKSAAGHGLAKKGPSGHKLAGVMRMIVELMSFFLQDALFLLGYLSQGNAFPRPLGREEEAALLDRMAKGDDEARESLITHNLRLCAHIARKYTVPGYDQDDLISIGTVGLIKGVGTYKPGTGTQLSTYCARCIENEILMCLRASQKRKGEISLQEPIGMDGEGNEITLIDVLGTEEDEVHGQVERRVSLQCVRRLVDTCLRGRERTVIEMRYGLLDGRAYAQQDVADKLGISRSYVSRIEKKAMLALRDAFEHGNAP